MQNFKEKIKNRLQDFYKELETVGKRRDRQPGEIEVVFATKYLNPDQLVSFLDIAKEINIVPITIGENRVQEAEEKLDYLTKTDPVLRKHFSYVMIGTLQKNKINRAVKIFAEIHSIDSLDLAKALDARLKKENKIMPVFLQVNVSGEASKHGFTPEELEAVCAELKLLKSLKIEGLLTMAPLVGDPVGSRPIFRTLRQLADRYNLQTSMGMSNDWKLAVEEGTDMIRIGGRIFK